MIVVAAATQGKPGVGGFPGGGDGGQGGGASDIRVGGFTLVERAVVAGGGGGSVSGPVFGMGGSAGFPDGHAGEKGDGYRLGGGGATATSGGSGSGNAGGGVLEASVLGVPLAAAAATSAAEVGMATSSGVARAAVAGVPAMPAPRLHRSK